MVKHTISDTIMVATKTVMELSRDQVRLLSRFYVNTDEENRVLRVSYDAKQFVDSTAKRLDVTKAALLYAIMTIFVRAALASYWKTQKKSYYDLISDLPEFSIKGNRSMLDVPRAKMPRMKTRPLSRKQDQTAMRHYNYMQEFKSYMDTLGGIDQWLNKNVAVDIYAHPLEGNVNRSVQGDKPKNENAYATHTVRMWKRGRGYNVTILDVKSQPDSGAPELEVGSVFRLYDIYRNIDWTTIQQAV
jgi:hypothetical protein